MPVYKYAEPPNNTFVNPYNFISIEGKCYRNHNYKYIKQGENGELLTGWLDCTLTPLTPLFIPNATNEDFFKKRTNDNKMIKSYDFYSYQNLTPPTDENYNHTNQSPTSQTAGNSDSPHPTGYMPTPQTDVNTPPPPAEPVIPGSEIRGVIRSAFEAVTNSCLSTTDDERLLFKRTTIPGKPGILIRETIKEDGKNKTIWKIQKCGEYKDKYMLKVYACSYDKDPNFVSSVNIDDNLWEELSGEKFRYQNGNNQWRNYFFIRKGNKMLDKKFIKINRKLSICNNKLCYHTKMTYKERDNLYSLSGNIDYQYAIYLLHYQSQKYHDRDELVRKFKDENGKVKIWFKSGGRYGGNQNNFMPEVIKEISFSERQDNGWKEGFLYIGDNLEKKHHESVFVPLKNQFITIDENDVENFFENMKLYKKDAKVNLHLDKKPPEKHDGYEHIKFNEMDDLNGKFIYYNEHITSKGIKYYLSPSAIGREVFHNKLSDLLDTKDINENAIDKDGKNQNKACSLDDSYSPCINIKQLCPACALFGIAGRDKGEGNACASRVRFTDAILNNPPDNHDYTPYFEEVKILPELASPKLSATEFYMKKPDNSVLWNYDYALNANRHEIGGYVPKIRGRKFYWHKRIKTTPQHQGQPSERNVAVRSLKRNTDELPISFNFKVYFNDITEKELKRLIWVLEIGGIEDNAHKMGMGKPVGLGSVRIVVDKVILRKIVLNLHNVLLSLEDILDWSDFLANLKEHSNPLLNKIWESFNSEVREILELFEAENIVSDDECKTKIISDINNILESKNISNIDNSYIKNRLKFNRISLESVYPTSIRKIPIDFVSYELIEFSKYLQMARERNNYINILKCNKNILDEFIKITRYNQSPQNVSYPTNVNSYKVYEWFVANKGGGVDAVIDQELPEITPSPKLMKYRKI